MDTKKSLRIVSLTTENVKRLKAVTITPKGDVVVIGGRNGQGKTSVLDSIAMALGGKDLICAKPVRDGAEKAKTILDLGELVVTRTYTAAGGSNLTVASKDGAKYPSPQSILDRLNSRLTFDPLEFSRMDSKAQAATLRTLAGVDVGPLDAKYAKLFAERTDVNRDEKAVASRLAALPHHPDAKPVSVTDLAQELRRMEQANNAIAAERQKVAVAENEVTRLEDARIRAHQRVKDLQQQLAEAESAYNAYTKTQIQQAKELEAQREVVNAMREVDTTPIYQQMQRAEECNRKVRENEQHKELENRRAELVAQAERLTKELEEVSAEKQSKLASAKLPVPGLAYDADGVTLNGIPFEQASAAEQLRVSVAMGLALNPTLKILLIRDGSLLDEDSLLLIAEMAENAGAQVWIERVGRGKECSVVIEDGEVATLPAAQAVTAE